MYIVTVHMRTKDESVPPMVIAPSVEVELKGKGGKRSRYPLVEGSEVAGANETPRTSDEMRPCARALSVMVGICEFLSGWRVPIVRSTGPTPMIPSTFL
jgi:hypothetical protein